MYHMFYMQHRVIMGSIWISQSRQFVYHSSPVFWSASQSHTQKVAIQYPLSYFKKWSNQNCHRLLHHSMLFSLHPETSSGLQWGLFKLCKNDTCLLSIYTSLTGSGDWDRQTNLHISKVMSYFNTLRCEQKYHCFGDTSKCIFWK